MLKENGQANDEPPYVTLRLVTATVTQGQQERDLPAGLAIYQGERNHTVNRQTLLYLSIGALALGIVGAILARTGSGFGTLLAGVGGLLSLVAWIMGLIMAGRNRQWGWLIGILLFTPLATLLYSLLGRTEQAAY